LVVLLQKIVVSVHPFDLKGLTLSRAGCTAYFWFINQPAKIGYLSGRGRNFFPAADGRTRLLTLVFTAPVSRL
jgi:hypothetical protein